MSDDPFADRFSDLVPGKRPGALGSFNGFGTTLVGSRDHDAETGTYVITHAVTALYIPLMALAAYRVAPSPQGGWYCLGRVPLSKLARWANVLVALAVVGGVGGIWWAQHVRSPEYVAAKKLDEADRAVAGGEAGKAAKLYREVMDGRTTHAKAASDKLAGLIETPPAEAAAVYAVAVDLHRDNRCPVPDLFGRGKAVVSRLAPDDPAAALALLEVIAPFAPDPAAELDLRRDLLERLLGKTPDDAAVASRLGAVYEARGEIDKCEKLLTPFEPRLGTLDGAAVLGRVHMNRGRYDQAHALLAPFVAARLPALHTAQADFPQRIKAAHERVIASLQSGNAPGFDYPAYKRADKGRQETMIDDYVSAHLKSDPAVAAARQALTAQRSVVGAVLDLGVVQLHRGQAAASPAARRAELEAAEKTFLSVRGVAGESDEYRLSLGQVYYWLGRPADGKKLFDEVVARGGSPDVMLQVATSLREVGDHHGARKLAEDAYARAAADDGRYRAARARAAMLADTDDELAWLAKCDPAAPDVQASLATARGHKAERDGNTDEAAAQYRRSLELYAKFPENAATFNNAALAHFALYGVTHDRDELTRGTDKLDRAIALSPSNTILLSNGGGVVLQTACGDVAGAAVDFRALKTPPSGDVLAYLYRTPVERAAVTGRMAAHPGAVKARAYAEKLVVLAPRRDESYRLLAEASEYTGDDAGLKAAADRAEKAGLDPSDEAKEYADYLSGASDAKKGEAIRAGVARYTTGLGPARTAGGKTFALAVGRYVRAKIAVWTLGDTADPDELVKLADEAHAAAPSVGTLGTVEAALLFRAHLTLMKDDAGYAATAAKTRRSFGVWLVDYVLAGDGPLRDRAAANADVRRLTAVALEAFDLDPTGATAKEWLRVKAGAPDRAAAVAEKAKANTRRADRTRLSRALTPYHTATALDQYTDLLLAGKPAEVKQVIADLAARGVPVP